MAGEVGNDVQSKFSFLTDESKPIAYVRPVNIDELPQELRAEAKEARDLYAVHDEHGERLALVDGRSLAFVLARKNDLAPVNVH